MDLQEQAELIGGARNWHVSCRWAGPHGDGHVLCLVLHPSLNPKRSHLLQCSQSQVTLFSMIVLKEKLCSHNSELASLRPR